MTSASTATVADAPTIRGFTSTDSMRTITPAIMLFKGANTVDWGGLMAGSILAAIPVLIFFGFVQRKVAFGLTAGAVKG